MIVRESTPVCHRASSEHFADLKQANRKSKYEWMHSRNCRGNYKHNGRPEHWRWCRPHPQERTRPVVRPQFPPLEQLQVDCMMFLWKRQWPRATLFLYDWKSPGWSSTYQGHSEEALYKCHSWCPPEDPMSFRQLTCPELPYMGRDCLSGHGL